MQKFTQNEKKRKERKKKTNRAHKTRHRKYSFTFTACLVVCKANISECRHRPCDTNGFFHLLFLFPLVRHLQLWNAMHIAHARLFCSLAEHQSYIESNDNKTDRNDRNANNILCFKITNMPLALQCCTVPALRDVAFRFYITRTHCNWHFRFSDKLLQCVNFCFYIRNFNYLPTIFFYFYRIFVIQHTNCV